MNEMENREAIVNQLTNYFSPIATIPEAEVAFAKDYFSIRHIKKGDFFIKAGEVPRFGGFIWKGLMRVFYIDEKGRDFTRIFLQEFDFASSHSAFLEQTESLVNIEALGDTTLLVISYDTFNMFIERHFCWLKLYVKSLERFFIIKERREGHLLWNDAKKRYIQFLKDFPGLEKRVKQFYIASYLGISPVSLSRIRATFPKTAE